MDVTRFDNPVDTTEPLFVRRFSCRYPTMLAKDIDEIKSVGLYSTGDKRLDKEVINAQMTNAMLTINEMVELYRKDCPVYIRSREDTVTIYELIMDHLLVWSRHLDRGINISKTKVLEVDGFGKITMARVTIGDKHYVGTPTMLRELRKEALREANKVRRQISSGKITKKEGRAIMKREVVSNPQLYDKAKQNMFIDNLLKKSGVNMTDTLYKYIKGKPELMDNLKFIRDNLRKLTKDEFDDFYKVYAQDFKDFSDYYRKVLAKAELGDMEVIVGENLKTLKDNLEAYLNTR